MADENQVNINFDGQTSGLEQTLDALNNKVEEFARNENRSLYESLEAVKRNLTAQQSGNSKLTDQQRESIDRRKRMIDLTNRETMSQRDQVRVAQELARLERERAKQFYMSNSAGGTKKSRLQRSQDNPRYQAQQLSEQRQIDDLRRRITTKIGANNINRYSAYSPTNIRTTDSDIDIATRLDEKRNRARTRSTYALDDRSLSDANRAARGSVNTINNVVDAGEFLTGRRYQEAITSKTNLRNALSGENGTDATLTRRAQVQQDAINQGRQMRDAANGEGNYAKANSDTRREAVAAHRKAMDDSNAELALLDKRIQRLTEMEQTYKDISQAVDKVNETGRLAPTKMNNPIRYAAYNNPAALIGAGVGAPVAALGAYMKNGMGIIEQDRQYTRNIGAAAGSYNSNPIRRQAERAGQPYGFSGQQMLQAEDAYMSGAGYTSAKDVSSAATASNMFARLNGASLQEGNELTRAYSQNVDNASSNNLKAFQQTFYGAIKQAGLDKYGKSQLTALTSLATNVAQNNGGSLTQSQVTNLATLQAKLGSSGEKSLLGQNGAQTMATLDSKLRGAATDTSTQFMMYAGNPQEFNGSVKGYSNLIQASQEGISNPRNLQTYLNGWQNTVGKSLRSRGASQDVQDTYLSNNLGINKKTAGAIRRLSEDDGFGKLNKKQYRQALRKEGVSEEQADKVLQQGSDDATSDKASANIEKASTEMGDFGNAIKNNTLAVVGASSTTLLFTSAVAAATVALGGMAASAAGSKVVRDIAANNINGKGKGTTGAVGKGASATEANSSGSAMLGSLKNGESATKTASNPSSVAGGGIFSRGKNAIGRVSSKATSVIGGVQSRVGESLANKGINLGSIAKTGAKGLGLLGLGITAVDTGRTLFSKKATNEDKGGALGTAIGGGLGAFGGIPGSILGSIVGNFLGRGIGKLTQSSAKSDETALADKRLTAEKLRQSNITNDKAFVDKYGRMKSNLSILQGKTTKNKSADSSKSSFTEDTKNDESSSEHQLGAAGGQTLNVVVSGGIKHSGTVETMEDLSASISGGTVPANLFSILAANEQGRK